MTMPVDDEGDLRRIAALVLGTLAVAWTILPWALTGSLPRDTLEALYWGIGAGWTSPKHPPLAPFLADAVFRASGGSTIAVYALGPVSISIALWVVALLGREIFSLQHGLAMAALSASVMILFPLSYEFNPNVILIPFWVLALLFGWRAIKGNKAADWCLLGLAAGLGFLSKYSMVMALISIAIATLATRMGRLRIRELWGPTLAVLIGVGLATPHLLAAAQGDFVTFHVAARDTIWEPDRRFSLVTIADLAQFIGGQVLATAFAIAAVWLTLRKVPKVPPPAEPQPISDARVYLFIVAATPFLLTMMAGLLGARTRGPWGLPLAVMTGPLLVSCWPCLKALADRSSGTLAAQRMVAAALVVQMVAFAAYFGKPSLLGVKNPLREHVDGNAIAAIAGDYWKQWSSEPPAIVLGLSNGALERQVIGSASLFMPGRPPAYQYFWVIEYGNRDDPELETFLLERDWRWIDRSAIAARGGLALAVGTKPFLWRRLGFCISDLESRPLPVIRNGYRSQTLWLAHLIPSEPDRGDCPHPPPKYRDAMGLSPAQKTMDRFKE